MELLRYTLPLYKFLTCSKLNFSTGFSDLIVVCKWEVPHASICYQNSHQLFVIIRFAGCKYR